MANKMAKLAQKGHKIRKFGKQSSTKLEELVKNVNKIVQLVQKKAVPCLQHPLAHEMVTN